MEETRKSHLGVAVLLLALLVRAGLLLLTPGALTTDPDGYRRLAENLVEHGTFGAGDVPTAYRPPLYPVLLSACLTMGDWSRAAIGVLHLLLGLCTVGLVLLLGRWLGLGNRIAALAALLIAVDPILLSQSAQVMTETPATFFATAGLAAVVWTTRRPTVARMFLAAVILGLGALCRPTLLPFAVIASVIGAMTSAPSTKLSPVSPLTACGFARLAGAFAIGLLAALSPWAIRNQLEFGRPIVTTTHGGYTLLLANNPEFYAWLHSGRWGDVWWADRFNAEWDERKPHNELEADRLAYAEALDTIRSQPRTFVYACLVRLGRFWSPLPHQIAADESPVRRFARYAVAVWYIVEFLLVSVGLCHLSPLPLGEGPGVRAVRANHDNDGRVSPLPTNLRLVPGEGPGVRAVQRVKAMQSDCAGDGNSPSPFILSALVLVACLTAAHTLYWTDMRMRAPLMPVVALAAAAGVAEIALLKKKGPLA
jgi:4-amino-4-deoxy-L-arabinose transferase-like glycosyltransferase